jgi:restriction system protein
MVDETKCSACGADLPDGRDVPGPGNQRIPCPNCGSRIRRHRISVAEKVTVESFSKAEVVAEATFYSSTLLMQAVFIPRSQTSEGQLVEAVTCPWFEIIELLEKDPTIAFQIPARKWEEIIAGAYSKAGFEKVVLTPRSGDYGRDVIATKKGLGVVRIIDQVKAYKAGHLVTADEVRALMGVLHTDGASKGFLTTTSDFAPKLRQDPLISPLIPSRLELVNGTKLLARLSELRGKKGGR